MTSQRSNRSNRTSHGGVQSSHVAQHLRRMSIIESRKARLADRAAHAEAVRLRAALAKAAPRTSTASEARAAAAQAAREKYLAQVAANCAEEVKRSKKIAEEMKEKKAAEHLKLKEDMQERLADAEKRRALYQQTLKRSRATSLPVVEESRIAVQAWRPLSEAAAGRRIQRAWRRFRADRIIQDFVALGLLKTAGKHRSFEDWTALVAQEDTISKTSRLLRLFRVSQGEAETDCATSRTFLSSFLILEHPAEILDGNEPVEQELQARARDLQSTFVRACESSVSQYSPSTDTTPFVESFARFTATFTAWKTHDASLLVNGIIAQFTELDAIWQTVKNNDSGGVSEDYKEGIERNKTLLFISLRRLLGRDETNKRLKKALLGRRLGAPRQMDTIKRLQESLNTELPSINETLVNPGVDGRPSSSANLYKTIHLRNLLSLTDPLPPNRVVIHELWIDRTYSLKLQPRTARWDEAMKRAFAGMQVDLEAGNDSPQIVYIAESIRSQLLGWMDPKQPQYGLVAETLDPKYIEEQIKNGSFSYEKFFNFMNGVLPKLCAPARDAEVKALARNHDQDLVERLLSLMHVMRMLSIDSANCYLHMKTPDMLAVAAKYEQQQFAEKMRTCRLDKTRRWWHEARVKTIADLSRRSPAPTISSGSPASSGPTVSPNHPSADKIYNQGLVTLFVTPHPLPDFQLPETLELDEVRIQRIRDDILHIITISTILLTAKNLLRRQVRLPWTGIFNQLWALPDPYANSSCTPYRSIIELAHALPERVKPALDGTIRRVLAEARNAREGEGDEGEGLQHPVMRIMLGKLREHVLKRLGANSEAERGRVEASARETLESLGLVEAMQRVNRMMWVMGRVKMCDWEGHGEWIEQVAKAAEGSGGLAV